MLHCVCLTIDAVELHSSASCRCRSGVSAMVIGANGAGEVCLVSRCIPHATLSMGRPALLSKQQLMSTCSQTHMRLHMCP